MGEGRRGALDAKLRTLVWDWPLRIWHWAFALCVATSLTTGLVGEIALMEWHLRSGYVALALLLFRLGWAFWGGQHARLASFRTSPAGILRHFRGEPSGRPRTAPGAALALVLLAAVAVQAGTGLYTSDEIFTEGPLVRHADDDTVALAGWLHHRVFWGVLALVAVHLTAQLVYALRRDPTALSMFTGRKRIAAQPARHLLGRALVTAAVAGAAVWWGLQAL